MPMGAPSAVCVLFQLWGAVEKGFVMQIKLSTNGWG